MYECCACRKKFEAHEARTVTCAHCGKEQRVRLGICSDCFEVLKGKAPIKKPYKCPVCNGRGQQYPTDSTACPACKGTGIIWSNENNGE
jgi:NMD protein affecting ribosome stability and mRNA decay